MVGPYTTIDWLLLIHRNLLSLIFSSLCCSYHYLFVLLYSCCVGILARFVPQRYFPCYVLCCINFGLHFAVGLAMACGVCIDDFNFFVYLCDLFGRFSFDPCLLKRIDLSNWLLILVLLCRFQSLQSWKRAKPIM